MFFLNFFASGILDLLYAFITLSVIYTTTAEIFSPPVRYSGLPPRQRGPDPHPRNNQKPPSDEGPHAARTVQASL